MIGGTLTPAEVPDAHAFVRRLCALQAYVVTEVLGHDDPADCFCGDEGFWPLQYPSDYRNAGKAVAFIEDATLTAVIAWKRENGVPA